MTAAQWRTKPARADFFAARVAGRPPGAFLLEAQMNGGAAPSSA